MPDRNIAAAQSALVLVTIHGSGSNNALFMAPGSALLEIRPYKFGTDAWQWAGAFMPQVLTLPLTAAYMTYQGALSTPCFIEQVQNPSNPHKIG